MNNYQRFLALSALVMIFMCPFDSYAQEGTMSDSTLVEKVAALKWHDYLWRHLQFTCNMCCKNMYGDNVVSSFINHLGHDDESYAMSGVKVSLDVKYNVFEQSRWNLYAGVGCALSTHFFKEDFVYLEESNCLGTFIHTYNPNHIAKMESKQPSDFGLEYDYWDSSFSALYITSPVGVVYETGLIEYGITLLPSIRIGTTSLCRDISIGSDEDFETLYESVDNSLDKHVSKFLCQLRLSCLFKGFCGAYVELGMVSMTKNLKHDIYSFSIGVQYQLTCKNL